MKYRGNHIPRKTPTNIRGYIIAVREPLGILKIPRKFRGKSRCHRYSVGISSVLSGISSINTRTPPPNLFIHSISSSSHILYMFLDRSTSFGSEHEIAYGRIQRGIAEFMGLVQRQPEAETGMLRCPCSNCKNIKVIKEWDVWTHLNMVIIN